ncbi:MAG: DUF2851 family protein [Nitrospinae bacterium]|nr:DUF2851 family protein [Nitrospinota bacterium]
MGCFSYQYFSIKKEIPLVKEKKSNRYGKKIPERLVRCIWLDQLFEDEIFTVDGRKIKVLAPGWWNLGEGPDFNKAVISIDGGKILKGDVEVHVYSSDWKKHGHHRDDRYKNVIAHVFMWNDGSTSSPSTVDSNILQIELSKFLKEELEQIEDMIDIKGYPYKSPKEYGDCSSISSERIGSLLDMAGDARMIEKAERFKSALNGNDWEQLLYEGIMGSLGYRRNKLQFKSLAKLIPLQIIKNAICGYSYKKRVIIIQSLLLGAGGLIPENPPHRREYSQEVKDYIKAIKRLWNKYRIPVEKNIMWDFYGTRPANLPFRRIAGISHFLSSNIEKGLLNVFLSEFLKFNIDKKIRTFINRTNDLFSADDDLWSFRYTVKGKRFVNKNRLIGRDRVLTIIVDVLMPVMLLCSKENGVHQLEENIHNIYTEISRLPSNSITRFMVRRMLRGERHIVNSARRGQALIQIFNDYCANNEDGCPGCTLKTEITKEAYSG